MLAIQRLKLGFPLSDGWRGEEALERLREWFRTSAPAPLKAHEWRVDGGRPVRKSGALGALSGADYGPEESLCAAGDLFDQMVSAVALLDGEHKGEDETLISSFAERSVADVSATELLQLFEAKKRLASSSAAPGRKLGLFDSVDAEMSSGGLLEGPEFVKPTEAPPAGSLVDSLIERLTKALDERQKPNKLHGLTEPQGERRVDRGERGRDGARKGSRAARVVSDEEEDEEGDEEPVLSVASLSVKDRLMAGIMTGGMALVKGSKAYKTLEERQMEDKIDRLHRELVRNKAAYPRNEFEVQLNYAMEEYCGLEVRLVRLETLVYIGALSNVEVRALKTREESLHSDMVALRRKRDVLQSCVGLKDSGDCETADEMYKLYLEEERGYLQNPEVEKLKKKARKQLKQEEGLRTLRHMSAQQKTQDDLVDMQRGQMIMQQKWADAMSVGGGGGSMRHSASAKGDGGRKRSLDSAVEVGAAEAEGGIPQCKAVGCSEQAWWDAARSQYAPGCSRRHTAAANDVEELEALQLVN